MFSRLFFRFMALSVIVVTLCGCAEINRRGGIVAQAEDYVLFTAHTKSHRLFRSYLLIGVLLGAARQANHNEVDRTAIKGNMEAALAIAYEAYSCLYRIEGTTEKDTKEKSEEWHKNATSPVGTLKAADYVVPDICQFFDEKMARLDYALYRLALSALFNERSNAQLISIREKLIGEIPVLSASAKAAIFAARAVNQTTTIVDDLLSLSFSSAGPVVSLLPLYRDSLELNMWVIVDSLTRRCLVSGKSSQLLPHEVVMHTGARVMIMDPPATLGMDCETLDYARYILSDGNGSLEVWRDFVWRMNYIGNNIEAYVPHFALVSRLIWRSCLNLLNRDECTTSMTKAFGKSVDESLLVTVSFEKKGGPSDVMRRYRASKEGSTTRFARERLPPGSTIPVPPSSPEREIDTTGSTSR